MLGLVTNFSAEHPTAFSRWLSAADFFTNKIKQVAVVGNLDETRTMALLTEIRKSYYPNMIVAASGTPIPNDSPSLLLNYSMVDEKPTVYVCEGFVCRLPVTRVEDLKKRLS